MKHLSKATLKRMCATLALATGLAAQGNTQGRPSQPPDPTPAAKSEPIPIAQVGAAAGKHYQGDGLSVTATPDGAQLRCVFQKLEGHATREGFCLTSTTEGARGEQFRVVASAVGRWNAGDSKGIHQQRNPTLPLEPTGVVALDGQTVQFNRPGLTEEYRVSMDGLRQDFVILEQPEGAGPLCVKLDVTGAQAEPLLDGVRLVLDGSGRKIAYSRLRVTDATGRELKARMEVTSVGDEMTSLKPWDSTGDWLAGASLLTSAPTASTLAVVVDDAQTVYPVRIDPTFSDENWISLGGVPGTDYTVYAAVVSGGDLYVGGVFRTAGGSLASSVAKWNGSSWSGLGAGLVGGSPYYYGAVYALAVSGSDLYVGGDFTTAGGSPATNVAKWNGKNWSALGAGVDGVVKALAVSGGDLYVGGAFTTAGGSPAMSVAKWDDSSWSALGSGVNYGVNALAVLGSDLYVGGDFTTAGGSTAFGVAKWNGSSWSALGMGVDYLVNALAVSGSNLYVGGNFTTAGGNPANNVAKWDGSSWSALGGGVYAEVFALAVSGGDLWACGSSAYKWNGTNWSSLVTVLRNNRDSNPYAYALAVSGSDLYMGGYFTEADGTAASYVAKWNGGTWSSMGTGLNSSVYALAVSGSDLYVGGIFGIRSPVDASAINRVAKWNGSGWSALAWGGEGVVDALAVLGGDLYVGGFFDAGFSHLPGSHLVKWNGSSWAALGAGVDHRVNALAVSGSNLYVGGDFETAGGTPASRVAKWNGSGWSALGTGVNGSVLALAVSGSDLYVGGWFTAAGGIAATNVAKWNGTTWSGLGAGLNGIVRALAVSGSDLYVGGDFTTAGGSPASGVTRWNGSSWSALGTEGHGVRALAMSASGLYAGGSFVPAGGSPASRVAKWNGSSWSALGSGVQGEVYALLASGGSLYVGGDFTQAGGKSCGYVAQGVLALPQITLLGNGTLIANGDATPSTADGTDFGAAEIGGATVARIFSITNSGAAPLHLVSTPRVAVSGPQATNFVVTQVPASPVATNSSTAFQVTFIPSALGLRTATLSITNNDPANPSYAFVLQGTGVDLTPPFLNCPANLTISADAGQCYASLSTFSLGIPATSDNSGFVSVTNNAPLQLPVGTNVVVWTAIDPSGNTNTCAQLVMVSAGLPVLTSMPQNCLTNVGATVRLSVSAQACPPLDYQWFKNATNRLADDGQLFGATTATLTLTNVQWADHGSYYCLLSNRMGSVTSTVATLTVTVLPGGGSVVSTNWATVRDGANYNVNFDELGVGYLMVKYEVLGYAAKSYLEFDLTGQQPDTNASATLTCALAASSGTHAIRLWALDQAYPALSPNLTWPEAQANPGVGNDMLTNGPLTATAILTAQMPWGAAGSKVLTIPAPWGQFIQSNKLVLVFTGTTPTPPDVNNAGGVRLLISNPARLPVLKFTNSLAPVILNPPRSQVAVVGAAVTLDVAAAGSPPLSYRWLFNDAPLADATNSASVLPELTLAQAGRYAAVVANAYGSVTSAVAVLTVVVPVPPNIHSLAMVGGVFTATFTNTPGATFTALGTTNLALPSASWTPAGSVAEVSPGQFLFTDPQATNSLQRFYRVRSP